MSQAKSAGTKRQKTSTKTSTVAIGEFDQAYGKLNDDQRRAVDAIEGPVLCIAGPGTGKTQVVAMRVANILKRTHMRPGNILCLTFSVNAATEMRERMRALIGPDAYGVTVKNFHGFCNDLIRDNPAVFENWSALEAISDVERYRLVNTIIDQLLPHSLLVNAKDPYRRTREFISRISELKKEGKTDAAELRKIASTYENDLAGRSKEGTKSHAKHVLTARKFHEFVGLFLRYQEELKRSQRYDYDDMILTVIEALREEDWLLASLQERYQYILVDEFQDTNGAQMELLRLLTTTPGIDHPPNLFAVGDDDQAIYRFQGANLKNILLFTERFPAAPIVPLTISYRCTQPILTAAERLISRNDERLVGRIPGLEKHLIAARPGTQEPRLLLAASDAVEGILIADLLQERIAKGIPPEEMAVLVQTNAELLPLYEACRAKGVPVELFGKADLLGNPFVLQAIAMLRGVEKPENDYAIAAALGARCFGCHPADLGRLHAWQRVSGERIHRLLLALDEEPQRDDMPKFTDRKTLIHARDTLLKINAELPTLTIVDALHLLFTESGLLALAKGDRGTPFDPVSFAALQEFFDRLKNRSYEQPTFSFPAFLADLEYYENPEYGELRLRYSLPHLQEKGVKLMTAHQSKGLEFTVVVLANFRDGHWNSRRSPPSVSVPEDLLYGWVKEQKAFERDQDERRVAFVAMTRAKDELIFTCARELTGGDKVRTVSPSGFFAEAGPLPELDGALADPERAAALLAAPVRNLDEELRAFLLERLQEFALSATALNRFLDDPEKFKEIDLLQVPQKKSLPLIFGNAVHETMKGWGMHVERGEADDFAKFFARFREYVTGREIMTAKERENMLVDGERILKPYFEERIASAHPVIWKVEHYIETVLTGDEDSVVRMKGKIDRIDLLSPVSADAIVIDYKTGKPKTESVIRQEKDYLRQLQFYALLLKASRAPVNPQSYVLDFIGGTEDDPVLRAFTFGESDLKELAAVIRAVWKKIHALDFTPL